MSSTKQFISAEVNDKFKSYPKHVQERMLFLRQLIFKVASDTKGVGELEEVLKWGEPSYLTSKSKSGTTVRIDWKSTTPDKCYIFFNCKTTLIDMFKEMYGDLFTFNGNRALILPIEGKIPIPQLSHCLELALTYKLAKK